jgi:hypothetical protein
MAPFRRIAAWAGLLCMLLHAGLTVLHRAPLQTATAAQPGIDFREADFAKALRVAMCGPRASTSTEPMQPLPFGPAEGTPCLMCCCPGGGSIVLVEAIRSLDPSYEPLSERIAWQARHIAITRRTAERPPVRGPPAVV